MRDPNLSFTITRSEPSIYLKYAITLWVMATCLKRLYYAVWSDTLERPPELLTRHRVDDLVVLSVDEAHWQHIAVSELVNVALVLLEIEVTNVAQDEPHLFQMKGVAAETSAL